MTYEYLTRFLATLPKSSQISLTADEYKALFAHKHKMPVVGGTTLFLIITVVLTFVFFAIFELAMQSDIHISGYIFFAAIISLIITLLGRRSMKSEVEKRLAKNQLSSIQAFLIDTNSCCKMTTRLKYTFHPSMPDDYELFLTNEETGETVQFDVECPHARKAISVKAGLVIAVCDEQWYTMYSLGKFTELTGKVFY